MPHALHRFAWPPSASGQPRRLRSSRRVASAQGFSPPPPPFRPHQFGVTSVPQLSQLLPPAHLRLNFFWGVRVAIAEEGASQKERYRLGTRGCAPVTSNVASVGCTPPRRTRPRDRAQQRRCEPAVGRRSRAPPRVEGARQMPRHRCRLFICRTARRFPSCHLMQGPSPAPPRLRATARAARRLQRRGGARPR